MLLILWTKFIVEEVLIEVVIIRTVLIYEQSLFRLFFIKSLMKLVLPDFAVEVIVFIHEI